MNLKLLGIIILVNSALRIHDAYEIKGISDKFMFYIINDIITLVLGIILIIMPISAAKVFVIIVGVLMVLLGVSNIVTAVKVYLDGKYIDAYDTFENGFLAYLKRIEYPNKNLEVEVLLKENDRIKIIYKCTLESGE